MKKYEMLEMEIVVFDTEDVITTSGGGKGPTTTPEVQSFTDLYLE